MAVALGEAALGALVASGTGRPSGLCLDQLLEDEAGQVADEVDAIAGTERVEQRGQVQLFEGGHRGVLLWLVRSARNTPRITPVTHLRGGSSGYPKPHHLVGLTQVQLGHGRLVAGRSPPPGVAKRSHVDGPASLRVQGCAGRKWPLTWPLWWDVQKRLEVLEPAPEVM
jgi:hypothetical protein